MYSLNTPLGIRRFSSPWKCVAWRPVEPPTSDDPTQLRSGQRRRAVLPTPSGWSWWCRSTWHGLQHAACLPVYPGWGDVIKKSFIYNNNSNNIVIKKEVVG